MNRVNINEFMDRFHSIELELGLFESKVGDEHWWDAVRFDVCYFIFGCLSDIAYTSAHLAPPRPRILGTLRRWSCRQLLFAKALLGRRDLMVIRAARSVAKGERHDVVLDPIIDLFRSRSLVIDTIPRRYHLPDRNLSRRAPTPQSLPAILERFATAFALDTDQAAQLDQLIQHVLTEYVHQVAGYHRLFDKLRPKAVLLVGVEKALFHVASLRGVPVIEAQHGLIGHGHPAYSYPSGVDYSRQTSLPALFLSFGEFWKRAGHYPARRKEVVGTDHFAADFGPVHDPLGSIMVISANIYHRELLEMTRQLALLLPARRFVYKLHPNQAIDEPAIRAGFADLPNVEVGDPRTPASQMMDEVSHLIAIQSTVVYEALQRGRQICILPRHDYQVHADILDLPGVSTGDAPEEIAAALQLTGPGAARLTFFERFKPERAFELLTPLLNCPE